jgi:hypothetical protein
MRGHTSCRDAVRRRHAGLVAAVALVAVLVTGIGAHGATSGSTMTASAVQQLPKGKPVPMPQVKGKRGAGPRNAGKARRVIRGKAARARPGGTSPGGLVPGGGTLKWHGWPAELVPQVGHITGSGCTGTVVATNLVLTAAHCIYDQDKCRALATPAFIPGMTWRNARLPRSILGKWGVWQVGRRWMPSTFTCDGGARYYDDWAVLEILPRSGKSIGDTVGWHEIWVNLQIPAGTQLYPVGYPASGFWATARGYHGRGQYACDVRFDGHWEEIDPSAEVVWGHVVPCPMNGGASGGPWFTYLPDQKKWVIGGVTGWCQGANRCQPYADFVLARYLDDAFLQFWRSVVA